ncbi:MAG: hypothetical protein MJ231_00210 [bacterium]|nr:hypothetical protein [bacterium]
MKIKLQSIIFMFFALAFMPVFADSWDDVPNLDRAWDGQKTITNKEFEEVMDALQAKQKKKEKKQKEKRAKKISGGGTSLHEELNPSKEITKNTILKDSKEGFLVNVPVDLIIDNAILEKGFYNVIGSRDKDNKKVYINFYQSQFCKGKVEVKETDEDFDESEVDFAKIIPYNESFVKLIFGSIDFNAYALVPYYTKVEE